MPVNVKSVYLTGLPSVFVLILKDLTFSGKFQLDIGFTPYVSSSLKLYTTGHLLLSWIKVPTNCLELPN